MSFKLLIRSTFSSLIEAGAKEKTTTTLHVQIEVLLQAQVASDIIKSTKWRPCIERQMLSKHRGSFKLRAVSECVDRLAW